MLIIEDRIRSAGSTRVSTPSALTGKFAGTAGSQNPRIFVWLKKSYFPVIFFYKLALARKCAY